MSQAHMKVNFFSVGKRDVCLSQQYIKVHFTLTGVHIRDTSFQVEYGRIPMQTCNGAKGSGGVKHLVEAFSFRHLGPKALRGHCLLVSWGQTPGEEVEAFRLARHQVSVVPLGAHDRALVLPGGAFCFSAVLWGSGESTSLMCAAVFLLELQDYWQVKRG